MSQTMLRVRPMQPDDLPAVMAIEDRVFIGDAWPESVYRRDLYNPDALYCVLELAAEDSVPSAATPAFRVLHSSFRIPHSSFLLPPSTFLLLGYAGCWFFDAEAHLMTIAIAPEWQGRGLGEWLLLSVLELIEARGATLCTLEVRVSNLRAQALYRTLGFEVEGRRRRYYSDNKEDALIMTTPPLDSPAMQALRRKRRKTVTERFVQETGRPEK